MAQDELLKKMSELNEEIAALPAGSIAKKRIKDKDYFYHRIYINGKRKEYYVSFEEEPKLRTDIAKRRLLEKELLELSKKIAYESRTEKIAKAIKTVQIDEIAQNVLTTQTVQTEQTTQTTQAAKTTQTTQTTQTAKTTQTTQTEQAAQTAKTVQTAQTVQTAKNTQTDQATFNENGVKAEPEEEPTIYKILERATAKTLVIKNIPTRQTI